MTKFGRYGAVGIAALLAVGASAWAQSATGSADPSAYNHPAYGNFATDNPCAPGYRDMSPERARTGLKNYGFEGIKELVPVRGWTAEAERDGKKIRIFIGDDGKLATFAGK